MLAFLSIGVVQNVLCILNKFYNFYKPYISNFNFVNVRDWKVIVNASRVTPVVNVRDWKVIVNASRVTPVV